jgi:hypothetical protein
MSPTTKKNNSGVLMRRASCSGWFADRPSLAVLVSGVVMLASFEAISRRFLAAPAPFSRSVAIVVSRHSKRLG